MVNRNWQYHQIEKVVASYASQKEAEDAIALLRKGGARATISVSPDGTDDYGSIKYSFEVVVEVTIITTQETLVW